MKPPSLRKWSASFQHAFEGVLDAYRSQRHMRVHFAFIACNAILALIYRLDTIEVALITVVITMVVFAEMINTVCEAIINIVCESYHPIARFAKDVAAGAVLVTAMGASVVGVCIYGNPARVARIRHAWVLHDYVDASLELRAVAMIFALLTVLLAALKVGRQEGSVIRGGVISGHAAYAFCCATCVYFLSSNTTYAWMATGLAAFIALMVAHLRLHDRAHRVRTVFYGAALGVAVPLIVFALLARPTP